VSRAATFVFFLGDRFFGAVTAYVTGPEAVRYHFTSALPVQVLKGLAPTLTPLLERLPPGDDRADEGRPVVRHVPPSAPMWMVQLAPAENHRHGTMADVR